MSYVEFLVDGQNIFIDAGDIELLQRDGPSHTIIKLRDGKRIQVTEPFGLVHAKLMSDEQT